MLTFLFQHIKEIGECMFRFSGIALRLSAAVKCRHFLPFYECFLGWGRGLQNEHFTVKLEEGLYCNEVYFFTLLILARKFTWLFGFLTGFLGDYFWVKAAIYPESNVIFSPLTNDGIDSNLITFSFPTFWWKVVKWTGKWPEDTQQELKGRPAVSRRLIYPQTG